MQYRVVRNACYHADVLYSIGDIMPELPVELLNLHMPNLELVAEEATTAEPAEEAD